MSDACATLRRVASYTLLPGSLWLGEGGAASDAPGGGHDGRVGSDLHAAMGGLGDAVAATSIVKGGGAAAPGSAPLRGDRTRHDAVFKMPGEDKSRFRGRKL